jgi:hypothetical protein
MASTTAQKLGIKPGTFTLVQGLSVPDAHGLIGELPEGADLSDAGQKADLVLLFAHSVEDVRRGAADAYASTADAGRCWIAYRKGANRAAAASSEPVLHRDTLQAALAEVGLDGVTLISIDDTWSAMRIKSVQLG